MTQQDQKLQRTVTGEPASHVASLVERANSGEKGAFDQLVDMFQGDIFRMVYYRTRSQMDAEDITQDVFVQAYKSLVRLKSPEQFRSWLFSIAVNKVRDFHRKGKFRALFGSYTEGEEDMGHGGEKDEDPDALDTVMRKDFWKQVEMLLEKLSMMEREVFMLRFMDHLGIREISSVLKKQESTVKTHLYRALEKFRREPSMRELLREDIR
ncbi:MAG: RNA polymerase sigma factor [Syntrophobacterales bacterium]|nr:MAG: RNA polymerase sigma factor [Syntrophobacterales bacterium]